MGADSKIEWTHHTFNAWEGCTKISPGCANCYAEARARRLRTAKWGPDGVRRIKAESGWDEPLKWDRWARELGERHRVFTNSLSDVFEDREELVNTRIRLFDLICRTPHLDWQLLTKRPEHARTWLEGSLLQGLWPMPNAWLGVSVEDQERADERIPTLIRTPAAVRFLSIEPLLGPVDISPYLCDFELGRGKGKGNLHWVIVGGESGDGARACDVAWIRSIVRQCREVRVPCFVKQLGSRPYYRMFNPNAPAFDDDEVFPKLTDPKGGDPDEWPEDLHVRQFPEPRKAVAR